MINFEVSILRRKVEDLEKRIEELEAFVKVFEQRGEVENCCDPEFMIPSDREGVKKNEGDVADQRV